MKFATFPETLLSYAGKFRLVNWVPANLDIPLTLPLQRYPQMYGEATREKVIAGRTGT